MNTKITKLLGIEYPVVQGAMAWIADGVLASSVSAAGGLGIIAGGAAPVDYIREQIRYARSKTDKPLGMNIMLLSPNADDLAQLAIDEKIEVLTTGAGNPGKYMEMWKNAGIKVMPVVASVALAKRMARAGADAVIAEGMEGGGHIGEATTMSLLPQVVDAVDVPVIGAGGIADGRGMAAALLLGAEGVQCGTVFLATPECQISDKYKELVLKASDISTVVTGRPSGHPVRALKTPLTRKCLELEKEVSEQSLEEIEAATAGSLRKAVQDGNYEEGTFMSGQIAGMLGELRPCAQVLREMTAGAEELLKNAYKRFE
ncbi:nitronate monooxygenase [Agathobaculum sp.]|uniref:nitronate monooxygenase n=1 Tax=Agathobaculum sp. TaxID=2048138 RepID=UPI002A83A9E3|nr:nitronate monooxygenase [Agathobaculum sp.]MDY3619195.1 nitronate monooxygenase [Agathobaculum sp.]